MNTIRTLAICKGEAGWEVFEWNLLAEDWPVLNESCCNMIGGSVDAYGLAETVRRWAINFDAGLEVKPSFGGMNGKTD